jgi:hypothetical protein
MFLNTDPGLQGCQMVCFQTKNPNLGKFWKALLWKILVYFMTISSILWPLEIFYFHLVYFVVILYIFPRFGTLDQEKSGNPAGLCFRHRRELRLRDGEFRRRNASASSEDASSTPKRFLCAAKLNH